LIINIDQSEEFVDIEINIKCPIVDERLENLISTIRLYGSSISGRKDNKTYFINQEDILYFDTVDEKVFIYTIDCVYETNLKLYAIEERFEGTSIIRVNKSTILNLMKVENISPLFNGKIEAQLQNGEKIVISRQYVSKLKQKIDF
jgi:DNA-binding LytR/AlgR family response regulator